MNSDCRGEVITDMQALAALEPEWDALWRRAGATPFQSAAWLLPWWRCFAPGALHVTAIRKGDALVGLAPLYLTEGEPRLLPIGISVSDYLDVLLDPERAVEAGAALVAHIARGRWTRWEMPDLPPHAARLPCPPGCDDRLENTAACPVLPLPAGAGRLVEALPSRKRRTLRMVANRAARRGPVAYLSLAELPAEAMLAELFRLHRLRWESRGKPGVLADPRVRAFHREAAPKLAAAGILRAYALRIGADIAAVYYGFLHEGRAYGYLTGMNPAFEFESPGTLLIAHALREAIREGAREFDFLRGGEAYKYGWGAIDRWNRRRVFQRVEADVQTG